MAKNPTELTPVEIPKKEEKEAPIQTAYRYLTTIDGRMLEIMTRSNLTMSRAVHLGYIFDTTIAHRTKQGLMFGNAYVSGYIAQVERLAVSMAGEGRKELIAALDAGGKLPDSYYGKGPGQTFQVLDED